MSRSASPDAGTNAVLMRMTSTGRSAVFFLAVISAPLLTLSAVTTAEEPQEEIITLDPEPADAEGGAEPAEYESAGGESGVVPFPAQGVNAREILSDLWFRHRALIQRGETAQADQLVTSALAFMDREGIRAAPEIGAAFLAEGARALNNGDYRGAREASRLALSFDPTLAAAHRALAVTLLRGDRDLAGSAGELWRATRTFLSDPESIFFLAGNGFLILYLGLYYGSAIGLMVLALRSAPALFHDIGERFSGWLTEDGAHLLGWTLLALPAALPLPLAWVLAVWGAIFLAYLRGMDRWVGATALVMLLVSGPAGRLLAWHFGTAADPTARALIQLVRTGPDLRKEVILEQIAADHPEDPIYPFLLASAYRAGGHFSEAVDMYRRVLEIDPSHARAMVNLGNLHALRHDLSVAQNLYRRAWETDPNQALAHYNSSLAHRETFNMEVAEAELIKARRIDAAMVNAILARATDERARRTPKDTVQPSGEIWKRLLQRRLEGGLQLEVARALTASTTVAGGVGLLSALLLPGLGILRRRETARRCRRCGRAFCGRCQVKTREANSCTQCVHLFVLRDGLAPGIRDHKMRQVVRYRRRIFVGTRIASLLLPGSGHVFGGRSLFGLGLLTAWSSAWVCLILRGRLLVPHGNIGAGGAIGGTLLAALGVALVVWLLANLSAHEASRD